MTTINNNTYITSPRHSPTHTCATHLPARTKDQGNQKCGTNAQTPLEISDDAVHDICALTSEFNTTPFNSPRLAGVKPPY